MNPFSELSFLGWDDSWADDFAAHPGRVPARIARVDKGSCDLLSAAGPLRASLAPGARRAADPASAPCAGDWAAVRTAGGGSEVEAILNRRTVLVRGGVDRDSRGGLSGDSAGQVLAANIDVALIVEPAARVAAAGAPDGSPSSASSASSASAGSPPALSVPPGPATGTADLGRIERLLALAWESGATPVVVITKADLAEDPGELLAAVAAAAPGVAVHAVSALTGDGVAEVESHLRGSATARTAVLLGASGAGKSTLVNALAGTEVMATQLIRAADGRGRHTTTHRQLIPLPRGGLIIDTPGLRRIGLFDTGEGLSAAFSDIVELAAHCRFADCSHVHEPECAVREAVSDGDLPERRLASWHKLRREAEWMAARGDARLRSERTRRWKRIHLEQRRSRRDGR